ncbi:unnamed protein product [Rotaria sp. Silwood2]|nr:unnamed protein product [Rotaria sp. Silwood2]CAF2812268.1 unnamed protein product [Rotaria sp. Silwood2]CAF3068159.1 unnamed protein product [Rotaria sp. Silwood2]CAF3225195.1 unnamed protein product [Rotaria sp. Silwood2]CAF4174915.1 unnamed protein product [Rotaria sp. Silwood2]
MYSNQPPPIYTTRHYIHDPQSNSTNNYSPSYDPSRPSAQSYPYYNNNQQPASVTYINDRQNYGQQSTPYVPPNTNRYPSPNNYNRNNNIRPAGGGGSIEKTNAMSNENPFYASSRPYEQNNTPRTITSITSPPKSGAGLNKTLNLSDENPFHTIYGGYHYPSQIDPSKRITTQNSANRSTENKSLNLSDESPFYSTYGRYHYPSQIDPQKRITEMPKAAAPLMSTNEMSNDNPFNNYRPPSFQNYLNNNTVPNSYSTSNVDWNRNNNNPPPLSYRPIEVQRPLQNYYNQQQSSSIRAPSPPSPPPPPPPPAPAPTRVPAQKPNSSTPLDKTSLNMSPDNPFAETYGQYHYPSSEEIKVQKRNNRFTEQQQQQQQQQPVRTNTNTNNNRPVQPTNQMTEYPETEQKETISGKGNTKFSRFDVNF